MTKIKQQIKGCKKKIKLLAFDYDGTLFESSHSRYNHAKAFKLIVTVIQEGYHVVIITARDASFRKEVVPLLQKVMGKSKTHCYLGGANGTYLTEILHNKLRKIYSYFLSESEITSVVEKYDKVVEALKLKGTDFSKKGIITFRTFLSNKRQWNQYISDKLLKISSAYGGRVFIEKSKISIVLPKDSNQQKRFKQLLSKQISQKFHMKGDNTFIHISKKIYKQNKVVDNKLFALQNVLRILKLSKQEVISFGDAPQGNDEHMLKYLPISFTNTNYCSKQQRSPFILSGSSNSVKRMHDAVNYMIGNKLI